MVRRSVTGACGPSRPPVLARPYAVASRAPGAPRGANARRFPGRLTPDDAELLHPEAERVGMQTQPLGSVAQSVDSPPAVTQNSFDARTLHGHQGVGSRFAIERLEVAIEQHERVTGGMNERARSEERRVGKECRSR